MISGPRTVPDEEITVLAVDDDEAFLAVERAYLNRVDENLHILEASSAEQAMAIVETETVDCIVSDYDMPGTDGIEFLEQLREQDITVPFILFTGRGSEEIASRAISVGVSDYIQKSGSTELYDLVANRIRNLTQKHRAEAYVNEMYEAINLMQEGFSLLDTDGRFTFVNDAYAKTFGYRPAELHGEHWSILYRNETDTAHMRTVVLPKVQPGKPWSGKTCHVRKDGSEFVSDHTLAYTADSMLICLIRESDMQIPEGSGVVVEAGM